MNKFVFNIFKTILFAVIFIFVLDIGFYMYKAYSLDQRMNSLMTSLQRVVMDNNYLPADEAEVYQTLFKQIITDYNSNETTPVNIVTEKTRIYDNVGSYDNKWNSNHFITGISWNYGQDSSVKNTLTKSSLKTTVVGDNSKTTKVNLFSFDMAKPALQGTVKVVEVKVGLVQPLYALTGGLYATGNSNSEKIGLQKKSGGFENTITYMYYVPCQHYQTVTGINGYVE